MNTSEINDILYNHPDTQSLYLGTYPVDQLPEKPTSGKFAITINYDESSLPGSHWVSIYRDDDTHFHDSLGFGPLKPQIIEFLEPDEFSVTGKQLQSKTSDVCGDHAIAFLIKRAQGFSTEEYLDNFGDDKKVNDTIVRAFVKSLISE